MNTALNAPCVCLQSEAAVIACVLHPERQSLLQEHRRLLQPKDFTTELHQAVWGAFQQLLDLGLPCDITSVVEHARNHQRPIAGPDLLDLAGNEVLQSLSGASISQAIKRLQDLSRKRQLAQSLQTIISNIWSQPGIDLDLHLQHSRDAIAHLEQAGAHHSNDAKSIQHWLTIVTDQIEKRHIAGGQAGITPTGIASLDARISGLQDGDLIYLAARPSMGKTASALYLARKAAQASQRPVLIFSTEQSGIALAYRSLAAAAKVDATRLRNATLDAEEWSRIAEGTEQLWGVPIHIDDTSELSLPMLRERARNFTRQMGQSPIIVVDYIQRMHAHRHDEPRIIIGEISTGLKNLAKELLCPVVCLAQLNRSVEARASKRPMLSDLAESGKIEQDGDIIVFLYRDDYYHGQSSKEPGITEWIIAKNRDGPIGVVKLATLPHYQDYQELHLTEV